jgi:prevent-host-death family protein
MIPTQFIETYLDNLKKISVSEARRGLVELINAVESGAEPRFILCQRGKPAALLLPLEKA